MSINFFLKKVLVNFIANWPQGKDRVWSSDNWGETIPLLLDEYGNKVPSKVSENKRYCIDYIKFIKVLEKHKHCCCNNQMEDIEAVSNSQELMNRPSAKSSNKNDKKRMSNICQICSTGILKISQF